MKVLAVETATSWQSVAILDQDQVLVRQDQEATGAHAKLLLPAIDGLLKAAGLRLSDVDGLACSIGPGSFTGIRVGVATCLGLRAATDLPLALVPTLEALAWTVRDAELPLCPVLTSRKGEVYWAIFRWTGGRLERILSERVGSPGTLVRSLTEPTMCLGEGWTAIETDVRAALTSSLASAVDPTPKPSAVAVGMLGLEKLRQVDVAGDSVAPLYVQRAEAELKYEASGGVSPVARRQERVARKTAERLARGRGTRKSGGK
jgi:tRNA threonylcarbamoyladenosine biosynthesis protein TsaB